MTDDRPAPLSFVRRALAAVREWLWLGAGARARRDLGADRAAFDALYDRARSRTDGAEVLWREGTRAEALAMIAAACDDLLALRSRFAPIADRVGDPAGLAAVERFGDRDETLPQDAERAFRAASRAAQIALARAAGARMTGAHRAEALGLRYFALGLAVFGAGTMVRDAWFTHRLRARASMAFNTNFAAPLAVDRRSDTSWLLPDRRTGWLHVSFPLRRVRMLRLLNVQRSTERGAAECRVQLYVGERVVQTIPVDLRAMVANPQPFRLPLAPPEPIDGVRIHVDDYVGLGGGLAEVEVE
jgi:hypothetical protein